LDVMIITLPIILLLKLYVKRRPLFGRLLGMKEGLFFLFFINNFAFNWLIFV
jgi:hypothetical protein